MLRSGPRIITQALTSCAEARTTSPSYHLAMGFSLLVRLASVALLRNRLRTGLTVVSIAIGVSSVLTIVALGRGAHEAIERQVASAGTNLIIVSTGNWTSRGVRLGMGSSSRLTDDDAVAIAYEIRGVASVSPAVRVRQQLVNGPKNWAASVEGVGAEFPAIRQWALAAGVFFDADHIRRAAKVCVVGITVRNALFGTSDVAIGRQIRIGAHIFRIIGVMTSRGQSYGGRDQDDLVLIPYTTAQKKVMGVTYLRNILVSAAQSDGIGRVAAEIRHLLRLRHRIAAGDSDDFRVRTQDDIVALRTRTTRTMTVLASMIAALSVVVGGIGIMNMMLVSVAERTREIGVRLAVGARPRDVRRQFLAEGALLTITGGALGTIAGLLASAALSRLANWTMAIAPSSIAMVLGFVAGTGVFFSWYPARRAARTAPIEALRSE
jgi:putative ABC transport system permease protein